MNEHSDRDGTEPPVPTEDPHAQCNERWERQRARYAELRTSHSRLVDERRDAWAEATRLAHENARLQRQLDVANDRTEALLNALVRAGKRLED